MKAGTKEGRGANRGGGGGKLASCLLYAGTLKVTAGCWYCGPGREEEGGGGGGDRSCGRL